MSFHHTSVYTYLKDSSDSKSTGVASSVLLTWYNLLVIRKVSFPESRQNTVLSPESFVSYAPSALPQKQSLPHSSFEYITDSAKNTSTFLSVFYIITEYNSLVKYKITKIFINLFYFFVFFFIILSQR